MQPSRYRRTALVLTTIVFAVAGGLMTKASSAASGANAVPPLITSLAQGEGHGIAPAARRCQLAQLAIGGGKRGVLCGGLAGVDALDQLANVVLDFRHLAFAWSRLQGRTHFSERRFAVADVCTRTVLRWADECIVSASEAAQSSV
jgi:hypothetical protein